VVLLIAASALAVAAVYFLVRPWARNPLRLNPALRASVSASAPGMLIDPLHPDRPAMRDMAARPSSGDWIKARPGFQYSRPAAERGGVEPCASREVDTSSFEDWVPLIQGHYSAPRALHLDAGGRFDLILHLNGDGPVRRELIASGQPLVLYTLTIDMSKSYAPLFSSPYLFDAIVAGIEESMSKKKGQPAHVGRIAMSAWSAGFIGIAAALGQPKIRDIRNIDAVILIDGLHAPRGDRAAFTLQLQPFVDYAKRAAAKETFMFISHSSIDPPNFASTTEAAHYLVSALGGKPEPVRRDDALGLELIEFYSKGNLHVRGYAGNDKADHCAQLALLRDAYTALGKRWAEPPARP
jgi:hypothetical protein